MTIFDIIGEIAGQILVEAVFNIPIRIYKWVSGKQIAPINGYRTERKKFIKFDVARKAFLVWENNIESLKKKVKYGLEAMNENVDVTAFEFLTIGQRTIIKPSASLSFYSFHFLVRWLAKDDTKTIGIVETARTAYTTYNDPNSENLIGQTAKGDKFFISLGDEHSRKQFLRINRDIKTIADYDVTTVKAGLSHYG